MVSLDNFPSLAHPGEIPICEKDGRICLLPITEVELSKCSNSLISYPDINISRELFHSSSSSVRDDRRMLMIPVNESLMKKITRTFFEEGYVEALNEAVSPESVQHNPLISSVARYLLILVGVGNKVKYFVKPHLKEKGSDCLGKISETRDWARSSIRCIKWHPNCFKIAVAASDDSIRVYTDEASIVPILKSGLQKCITSLSWRPYTAGEIAVGCQNGALVWTLDPNSLITRPLSQATHLKYGNHFPVSSLEWSPNGSLLATGSINDSDILIWDVDQNRNTPLKRVGPPCASLKWSPDGSRLCTTTVGNVFRVWQTNNWTPDRWTINHGAIQSVAWSPCGSQLLFVTTGETYLYSLGFIEDQIFAATLIPKSALPIADLSKITIGHSEVGGRPQSLAWCPQGQYLAITFKDTSAIAIFNTAINKTQLNITPSCFLTGIGAEFASYICFQENNRKRKDNLKTVLTIGWSSGRIQYFPFV